MKDTREEARPCVSAWESSRFRVRPPADEFNLFPKPFSLCVPFWHGFIRVRARVEVRWVVNYSFYFRAGASTAAWNVKRVRRGVPTSQSPSESTYG